MSFLFWQGTRHFALELHTNNIKSQHPVNLLRTSQFLKSFVWNICILWHWLSFCVFLKPFQKGRLWGHWVLGGRQHLKIKTVHSVTVKSNPSVQHSSINNLKRPRTKNTSQQKNKTFLVLHRQLPTNEISFKQCWELFCNHAAVL